MDPGWRVPAAAPSVPAIACAVRWWALSHSPGGRTDAGSYRASLRSCSIAPKAALASAANAYRRDRVAAATMAPRRRSSVTMPVSIRRVTGHRPKIRKQEIDDQISEQDADDAVPRDGHVECRRAALNGAKEKGKGDLKAGIGDPGAAGGDPSRYQRRPQRR